MTELLFKVLNIPDKNITVVRDADYNKVEECWESLKKLYNNARKGPPTLFVIWYGGHGEMGGSATTQICCNSQDPERRLYPWESSLMTLAEKPKTFTLAFFDCCRV